MNNSYFESFQKNENLRNNYWKKKDPILPDRLFWRAQSFRHLTHILPGETILEIGTGDGQFTEQLYKVTRKKNPITTITFNEIKEKHKKNLNFLEIQDFLDRKKNTKFDYVVSMDLLDEKNSVQLLSWCYELLKPGGKLLVYESNPWNPVWKIRKVFSRFRKENKYSFRPLLNRTKFYELVSDIGFLNIFSVFNDFVYAPLSPYFVWLLRNLSIILENAPLIQTMAGSILLHAQKPPKERERRHIPLGKQRQFYKKISIVIPCHNEEMNIVPLIELLLKHFGNYIHEIIPVDDNSRDKTWEIISNMAQKEPRIKPLKRSLPNGVGLAIRDGILQAEGEYLLTMDCDFQHLLPEINDMFDALSEDFEVIIGSRFSRHSVLLNYPFKKIVANRSFHLLAQLLLKRKFRDVTNNLKLMKREVYTRLILTQQGFAVNAETGLLPFLMNSRIKEIPVSWINRSADMGTSSFDVMKVGNGYFEVLKNICLSKYFRKGVYKELIE